MWQPHFARLWRSPVGLGGIAGVLLVALIIRTQLTDAAGQTQVNRGTTPVGEPIHSLIEQNCQVCHNALLPNGSVDLQRLISSTETLSNEKLTWMVVANDLSIGKMPPQGAPRPPQAEIDKLIASINSALASAPPPTRPPAPPPAPATNDWLTFSYDGERTGWNRAERSLTRDNVGQLQLLWKLQLDALPNTVNRYSSMTDAVVAQEVPTSAGPKNLVFVASADNDVYAIDADKGAVLWKKSFPNLAPPAIAASNSCPNNLNATPVIDRANSVVYVLPNDGKLRGLNLADGAEKFPATQCVPPYTRNFSLNLVDGVIYAGTTRGCGGAISEIIGVDLATRAVSHFYASTGKASGPWGRGGIVRYPYGVLAQTADGAFDPGGGRWGMTMLGLNKFVRLQDSFTPADEKEMNARDFDFGSSSPVVFPFDKWTLVATSCKEGSIFLLDAAQLGGADHRTALYRSPRFSNDSMTYGYTGMWSVMSTFVDAQGQRWLLAPFYGPTAKDTLPSFPKQHGEVVNGSLMAFKVALKDGKPVLQPAWISSDLDLPGIAVVANNLIFILANGDRGSNAVSAATPGGGRGRGGRGPAAADAKGGPITGAGVTVPGLGRALPLLEVNPNEPGFEHDAAWRADQLRPFDQGGQKPGQRFTGGQQTTQAVLYVLDPATGDALYSSGAAIDSWNHYGGLALSNGKIYVSSYDNRVYAFGVKK